MLSEHVLEDFLMENLNIIEPGLRLIKRQYYLVGKCKIDLLCKDTFGKIVVVEIKMHAGTSSVKQAGGYRGPIKEEFNKETVRVMLVCLSYSKNVPAICKKSNIELKQIKDDRIPFWSHVLHLPTKHRNVLDSFVSKTSSAKITSKSLASSLNMPEESVIKCIEEIEKYTTLKFNKIINLNRLEVEYKLKL
tara:strand:+ start:1938 stop:2510 length:573 start_codon:yes stop_codon:yes gene_type:complete